MVYDDTKAMRKFGAVYVTVGVVALLLGVELGTVVDVAIPVVFFTGLYTLWRKQRSLEEQS